MLDTGTDRDDESDFWNVDGFDYEHDTHPAGKSLGDIIYAFTIALATAPYLVYHDDQPITLDITDGLTEHDGIIVYDSKKLGRRSKNEYWFITTPLDAALLVFNIYAS